MQDGGTVDPVSGNEVPVGSLQEEVRDDIPAKLSEGEFVVPADVVRYIGLEKLMKMRDAAKEGLERMEEVGQMGNADTAPAADEDFDDGFDTEIDDIIGEVDGELQMAEGGFVAGQDLSKAPKNPAVDVRYFKHPDGRMMFVTFINNRPMTAIPEGFTQTEGPVEQKVGKAAEERDVAAGSGGSGGSGGGGGGGDGVSSGEGGSGGFGVDGLASTGLGLMAVGEKLGKVPSLGARVVSKVATFAGEKIADRAMDKMTEAYDKVAAPPAMPGMGTFAAKDGSISTITTPSMIADYDNATFGLDTGMDVNSAGQTVSNTATIAAQNEAIFGSASGESGFSMGNAAETGMGTNAAGQSVSTDATVAAQDAAMFGGDSNTSESNSSSNDGTYCCSRMVHLGVWGETKELARMHVWHHAQPKWWIAGYSVWGKIVANTLFRKKGFWTDVMQAFYDHRIKNKPRTLKSVIADLVIYPGVFVCSMLWRNAPETTRYVPEDEMK